MAIVASTGEYPGGGFWFVGLRAVGLGDTVVETEVLHFVQDDKFVSNDNREDTSGGYGCADWGSDGGGG